MARSLFFLATTFVALILGQGPSAIAAAPEPIANVSIRLDVSEAPKFKGWGEKAKALCETWYPTIADLLETEGFTPPKEITLVFRRVMDAPAATAGSTIFISREWVSDHPDDFGMVIHELTHVVQSYPKYHPVWIVEGIADYVRYWRFEPTSRKRRFDPKHSRYRNGYQPAAAFLAWLDESRHKGIIRELNKALRKGDCTEETIKTLTGKSADDLWNEFLASRQGGPRRAASALSASSPLADIGPAPSVSLTDAKGQPFELTSLRGKAVLVSFIYTTCNGSCPATTHSLYRVQQTLKEAKLWGNRAEFVSVSLDPAKDTPEVLENYARLYDADPAAWHFVTGSPDRVAKVNAAWGMWAKVGPSGTLDHPSRIFLVDPRGHEREIYNLEYLKPDSVLQDIKTLLAEGANP